MQTRRMKKLEDIHHSWIDNRPDFMEKYGEYLGKTIHVQMTMSPSWLYLCEANGEICVHSGWLEPYVPEYEVL